MVHVKTTAIIWLGLVIRSGYLHILCMKTQKYSVYIFCNCWASGLTEDEAADFAASLRIDEGRKGVWMIPDQETL